MLWLKHCEFGPRKDTQECVRASDCPGGRKLVSRSFAYCFPPGAVCCEKSIEEPKAKTCGTVTPIPRIGVGVDSLQCSSPWQVSLRRRIDLNRPISKENSEHICGGTLVDNQWILTSPFCFYFAGAQDPAEQIRDNILIVAGDWNHVLDKEPFRGANPEQEFRVDRWNVHPEFAKGSGVPVNNFIDITILFTQGGEAKYQENAFVLVKLDRPTTFTDCVRPICLPDPSDSSCGSNTCRITGWGHNENEDLKDILQQATMTIFSPDACDAIDYYRLGANAPARPERSTCARNAAGAFPCVGDQGGPLACQGNDGRWTLRGTLLAKLSCDENTPLPVADTAQAADWIKTTIQ
ncbi:chymotrypsinogen B-like [Gigantopelta aegis]|uniref:chymotrypsinogen B-like n=1 Tax=Gigantopelta aegis TaxID=1735272 RepID=UPI001B88D785|nr:chymotrypsinogen B-like [Gigantopelta aegis]